MITITGSPYYAIGGRFFYFTSVAVRFPPFFSCFKCTLTISSQQKLYKYFDWNLFCDDGIDDGQDVIESILRHLFCLVQILITTSERKEQKTDLLFILRGAPFFALKNYFFPLVVKYKVRRRRVQLLR